MVLLSPSRARAVFYPQPRAHTHTHSLENRTRKLLSQLSRGGGDGGGGAAAVLLSRFYNGNGSAESGSASRPATLSQRRAAPEPVRTVRVLMEGKLFRDRVIRRQ